MKKKPILLSLLIFGVLAAVLTISVVFAKYSTTLDNLPDIDFNLTQPDTYTYAVLDKETGALSIRNRPAKIVDGSEIGEIEGTKYLVDKDDSYALGDNGVVYALPEYFAVENVPSGAITGQWKKGSDQTTDWEKSITSVMVADDISIKDSSYMFQQWVSVVSIDLEKANFQAVTNMTSMFDYCSKLKSVKFATTIDTQKVTKMEKMFYNASALKELDLTGFDTQNVESMKQMFSICTALQELDVSSFNTSSVTNMSGMFSFCASLKELRINHFTTSAVTDMREMFYRCRSLTSLDVSNFNTQNVKNMSLMFGNCFELTELDISNFNTSNVTNMSGMFSMEPYNNHTNKLVKLTLSPYIFITDKVTDMSKMFYYCDKLTSVDLSKFNTAKVKNMSNMFAYCKAMTRLDLSSFKTPAVTNMSSMFLSCTGLTELKWDTEKFVTTEVTNMSWMFADISLTSLHLSHFDTSKVKDMSSMFQSSEMTELYLGENFVTSAVTNMSQMFWKSNLSTIYAVKDFEVATGTNTEKMFENCTNLKGGNGTNYSYTHIDGTYARIDGVNGQPGYFTAPTHDHQGGDNWVGYVDELHGKYCSVYGEPLETQTHTYVDGKCEVCSYICQHSKIELLPNDDGTTHSGTCPTCNTDVKEEHTYTEGVCSKCQYQCTHTVSEGTIDNETHGGTCTVCMIAVSGSHTYDNGITDDSGITAYTCSVCGHTKTETPPEDTTGGGTETVAAEPTCTCETKCEDLNADCEVCKTDYNLCKIKDAA